MKTLIAVAGCHERQAQADAQRQTWVKDVQGADVRFFAGWPPMFTVGPRFADEVWLDCPDYYATRKLKVIAMMHWAFMNGYEYMWKVDDDVYLRPERLLALPFQHYQGCAIDFTDRLGNNFMCCKGWIYGLSRVSMGVLSVLDSFPNSVEDLWVGGQLKNCSILPHHLGGFGGHLRVTHKRGVPNGWANQEPPHPNNNVVASCEYTPEQLVEIHSAFESKSSTFTSFMSSAEV